MFAETFKPNYDEEIVGMLVLGLTPVLLTGDNEAVARAVAAEVGIDQVIAEVMPKDKVDTVARLQQGGAVVAMVGDGVNDAAALAQADLGLSMGTGTDAAIEASDLTLVRGDLRSAVDAIRLSRRTLRTIKGNLFWAFAYNVAAIPLAALGLLNPMLAGGAMAFSSVFVVTNSLRLRTFTSTATPESGSAATPPARRPRWVPAAAAIMLAGVVAAVVVGVQHWAPASAATTLTLLAAGGVIGIAGTVTGFLAARNRN